jgi:hypothetical protein
MKRLIALIGLIALTASAQTNILTVPSTPPTFPTNQLASAAGGSAVATFALNLLPYWDKTRTNDFAAKELELEVSPTWKSATASGSTPYLSIGGNYFFTKSLGAGGDIITFGNGTGTSDLDSAHGFFIGRKELGNVEGHVILGGGRDNNRNDWCYEAGAGIQFRYSTGIGLLVDTRYVRFASKLSNMDDSEFLTRVGVTIHF